jgi:uncharacterized membrane protein
MAAETARIEAYSDGVFSIAATLLVLDLKPPASGLPFWQGIAQQWPGYASFLMSFLYIGIMWMNHHRLFTHIKRSDDWLMGTNLLLLLAVVWIPYPTSLLTLAATRGDLRNSAILYNGSYIVLSLLFNLLLFTCRARNLVDRQYGGVRYIRAKYAVGPLLYGVGFLITWWSVPVSLALNGALAIFFVLSPSARATVACAEAHAKG